MLLHDKGLLGQQQVPWGEGRGGRAGEEMVKGLGIGGMQLQQLCQRFHAVKGFMGSILIVADSRTTQVGWALLHKRGRRGGGGIGTKWGTVVSIITSPQ